MHDAPYNLNRSKSRGTIEMVEPSYRNQLVSVTLYDESFSKQKITYKIGHYNLSNRITT